MSGLIPYGLSVAAAEIQGLIGPIIIRQRNIGGFVADVTVRENHEDELVVTENPVEQGAAITDHSFKQPPTLTVDVGYSNSSIQSGGDPNYVNDMYAQFLELQVSRQPFDVITGKRQYPNMLITMLHTFTDEKTEDTLFLTVRMKQVILVSTQTVSVPPAGNQADPSATGATQKLGTQQLTGTGTIGAPGSGIAAGATPFNYNTPIFSAGFGTGTVGGG
jgi:hypothetical protein